MLKLALQHLKKITEADVDFARFEPLSAVCIAASSAFPLNAEIPKYTLSVNEKQNRITDEVRLQELSACAKAIIVGPSALEELLPRSQNSINLCMAVDGAKKAMLDVDIEKLFTLVATVLLRSDADGDAQVPIALDILAKVNQVVGHTFFGLVF